MAPAVPAGEEALAQARSRCEGVRGAEGCSPRGWKALRREAPTAENAEDGEGRGGGEGAGGAGAEGHRSALHARLQPVWLHVLSLHEAIKALDVRS